MAFSMGECRLQSHLDRIGMSQAEFARRSGYSKRMVSHWCTGEKKMSPEAQYTAFRILGVPMHELYVWIEKSAADT